jgi:hypothetical protein
MLKTIHVQYTGTQQIHVYLIGSNIQFSTNTEKEQVIIKKKLVTMNKYTDTLMKNLLNFENELIKNRKS